MSILQLLPIVLPLENWPFKLNLTLLPWVRGMWKTCPIASKSSSAFAGVAKHLCLGPGEEQKCILSLLEEEKFKTKTPILVWTFLRHEMIKAYVLEGREGEGKGSLSNAEEETKSPLHNESVPVMKTWTHSWGQRPWPQHLPEAPPPNESSRDDSLISPWILKGRKEWFITRYAVVIYSKDFLEIGLGGNTKSVTACWSVHLPSK